MFVEQKGSYRYLVKKTKGIKISCSLRDPRQVSVIDIDTLTQKECEGILSKGYCSLLREDIYYTHILKDVLIQSLFLQNILNIYGDPSITCTDDISISGKKYVHIVNDFHKEFIYQSNRIEGSKIPREILKKVIEEKKYTYSLKNEIQEVKNSQQAFDFINQKFVFNQTNIKRLYHILTKSLLKSNGTKYRRGYKILDNVVGNSKTTAPENVDRDMEKLLSWYHENKKITCPFVLAFEFHLRFEQIHPFEDGNGRTGRLLMNKILMMNNLLPMMVFEENTQKYFNAIRSAETGYKQKYYSFMLDQYKKTLEQVYYRKIK